MPQKTIENKPFYALAGVADLAAAKLRELPEHVPAMTERAEHVAGIVRERFAEVPAEVRKLREDAPAELRKLRDEAPAELRKLREDAPAELRRLRDEAPAEAKKVRDELPTVLHELQAKLVKATGEFADTYEQLSERGVAVVSRFRKDDTVTPAAVEARSADVADANAEQGAKAATKKAAPKKKSAAKK